MVSKCINDLKNGKYSSSFKDVYPHNCEKQAEEFINLAEEFGKQFEDSKEQLRLFSSPGRTEIGGNHTDHQRGRVLAASVSLDNIAIATDNKTDIIKIYSEGYDITEVNINDTAVVLSEVNTTISVVRGIVARLKQLGYKVGGFNAYVRSNVPTGSGVSSSASFENLVTSILSSLYNNDSIDKLLMAQIGQYAENEYFGKPSGLMDQAASAIGGAITIDFKDLETPKVEAIEFDLSKYDYSLCVVNTHSDHADLTDDYADIFKENQMIANYFGKDVLSEVEQESFYKEIPTLRKDFGERAVVRAMHFFDDNDRVPKQVEAIKSGNFEEFKRLIIESGESSFNRLQNIYSSKKPTYQPISLALEYSRKLLEPVGGAWRVHGGGFAGTIQSFVPNSFIPEYKEKMDYIFGKDATQVLEIRAIGSTELKINK